MGTLQTREVWLNDITDIEPLEKYALKLGGFYVPKTYRVDDSNTLFATFALPSKEALKEFVRAVPILRHG